MNTKIWKCKSKFESIIEGRYDVTTWITWL